MAGEDYAGFCPRTAVNRQVLERVIRGSTQFPESFHLHPKLRGFVEKRRDVVAKGGPIDWAFGEALAFGTLVLEGTPVRLSGQDSGRGTFSQRHLAFYDSETGKRYVPLQHIAPEQGRFDVLDSSLSEYAVLGFEFGYSVADPLTLVIWEAQFGDFANGAQIMIDQFISCCEQKWGQPSGLVMLLPHGFEGQGPEHSSARIERYLTLCAENNMQVCNCTTPAQYFHLLRRQMYGGRDRRGTRKPLIIFTPKSLLRHPRAVSTLARFHRRRLPRNPARYRRAEPRRFRAWSSAPARSITICCRRAKSARPGTSRWCGWSSFTRSPRTRRREILARLSAGGRGGMGAGRAAQHGRLAFHTGPAPAAARCNAARVALCGPAGKRQPRHRIGQAAPAGTGGDRGRRADAGRRFRHHPDPGGTAEEVAGGTISRRPARMCQVEQSAPGAVWQPSRGRRHGVEMGTKAYWY